MSTATAGETPAAVPVQSKLWRPPFVGLVTTVLMLLAIGVGHAMMVAIEDLLGTDNTYIASIGIGFLGIVALWYGIKSKSENFATWTGFFAGLIVWMAWVEFFYMYYGRKNFGMMPRMEGLEVTTEPEYLIMTATIGVLLTQLAFYTFDKDTRCNMFLWIQNRLGLRAVLGPSTKTARDRNYAIITFMETFYVTWFVYAWNLLIFDPAFGGGVGMSDMVATGATVFVSIAWGGFCFSRLIRYRRVSTALRYAIPTANILWINVEIFSKWGLFTEVWLEPQNYLAEMGLIVLAFVAMAVLIHRAPKKPSETGEWGSEEGATS
ncbi:MAG: hypothetical protein JNK40_11175 [Chromatiales bacterium]|nr:hypothetical protein [Chromatiales bacterium]